MCQPAVPRVRTSPRSCAANDPTALLQALLHLGTDAISRSSSTGQRFLDTGGPTIRGSAGNDHDTGNFNARSAFVFPSRRSRLDHVVRADSLPHDPASTHQPL